MKTIYAILFLIIFCSCNVKKNVQKTKEETKTDVTDNSVITRTITERADTLVIIPADTLTGKSDNLEITPIIEFKDGLELIVKEDKVTHKITATAIKQVEKAHVLVTRVSVENEEKHIHTKADGFKEVKDKQVERTGGFNWNWLWLIIAAIVFYLFWRFRKK